MFQLIQSEKAYNLQTNNVFTLGLLSKKVTINKIVILKALTALNLEPLEINSQNTYAKNKKKGKKFITVRQERPKKFYVKLAPAKKIDDETMVLINQKIFTPVNSNK
jgi:ribosomal protein L23